MANCIQASAICTSFTRLGSASKSLFLTLLGLGLGLATQANGLKIKGNCEITVLNPVYVLKLLPA